MGMDFAESIIKKLQMSDLDLYDKSGFLRFRVVDGDNGNAVRVWKLDKPHGELSLPKAIEFIASNLKRGLCEESDFVWI